MEPWVGIRNTECVEPAAQIPHEPMPCTDDLSTRERLETTHRPRPPFQMLMVALDALLHHLAFDVLDLRQDCGERGRIDCRPVSHRNRGCDLSAFDGPCQERGGCSSIPRGTDVNVDHLAILVDGSEGITPPARDPDIRLINTPLVADTMAARSRSFLIQGCEPLDPVKDR